MDLFDLVAKITLDTSGYESGLADTEKKTGGFGKKLKSGLATAGKVAAAGLAVAMGAVVSLGKQAIEAYANYEQLVGGVETLFKDSADLVQQYAANAYKTAGLSANEYMETVTSFSASLLQSLGGDTEKAAKIGDMAITDMADNANKMGTSMEAIQNAYQGFAKQNYTMLDNLKLGYGGTKTEMERLLADATALSGVEYDIESLSDVYEAIHVIQGELKITGTTAKEASTTISGSLASMKSAWHNLVVGVANENADFETLVNNFVDSVGIAANNVIPRIGIALNGIGLLVQKMAPIIAEKLPQFVSDVLPPILSAASTLLNAVVAALPALAQTLVDAAPQIIETLIDAIVEMSPELVEVGFMLILAVINGITASLPKLMEKAPEIVKAIAKSIINNADDLLIAVARLFGTLLEGIENWFGPLLQKGREIVNKIGDGIKSAVKSALTWGRDLIDNFVRGIKERVGRVVDAVKGVASKVKGFLGFSEPDEGPLSNFHTYAPDMMELFAKGIRDNEHLITDQIAKSFDFGNDIANIGLTGNGTVSGGTTNTFGAVSISIYPREGQDADEIADAVMERIQLATERKAAAVT